LTDLHQTWYEYLAYVMWAPVTAAKHVFWLHIVDTAFRYGGYILNILNKQSQRMDKGWFPSLEVGQGANI